MLRRLIETDLRAEPPDTNTQRLVDRFFRSESLAWAEIYERDDVYAIIHQDRRATALAWIDDLHLPPGSRILDVGCGAGLTAVELARRDFEVDAVDPVPEMIALTQRHTDQAGVATRVRPQVGDVHALRFDDERFDVVVALGVIPWLHSPQTALYEVTRVLRPGGHLVINADNSARLTDLLDPRYNPALRSLRAVVKRLLERSRLRRTAPGVPVRRHSRTEFKRLLSSAGTEAVKGVTLGFGPFTLLGHRMLPAAAELKLHQWLQSRADRGVPGIRSSGAQYLVLARKRPSKPD